MTEALAGKRCTPCRGGVPPLTPEEAQRFQAQTANWELHDGSHRIERTFRFSNFQEALAFDPIKRSTWPFCQGDRKDVGLSRMPIARIRALNAAPNARSLSRTRYFGAVSHGNASVIWRANHSAVGWWVTANHNNCRRL
jgi:hypothetical protein